MAINFSSEKFVALDLLKNFQNLIKFQKNDDSIHFDTAGFSNSLFQDIKNQAFLEIFEKRVESPFFMCPKSTLKFLEFLRVRVGFRQVFKRSFERSCFTVTMRVYIIL